MSDEPKATLPYEPPTTGVSRRQFRWLLVLILLQTVMMVQSTYAPGVSEWIRARWAQYQQDRKHAQSVAQKLAADRQMLAIVQPADSVVWEEDPARAASLLLAVGYQPVSASSTWKTSLSTSVPLIAYAAVPKILNPLASSPIGGDAVIFAHGRAAAGGAERLVVVRFDGKLVMNDNANGPAGDEDLNDVIGKMQSIYAASYGGPDADGEFVLDTPVTELSIHPGGDLAQMPMHWKASKSTSQPGTLKIDYIDQLRVFAGQPDPADTSHFTIHYELDGQPGDIDGWLAGNGIVRLKPREGIVRSSRWYPHAK